MVCELLAIKLLKDFSMRELIDALSYDFNPLQGQEAPGESAPRSWNNRVNTARPRAIRISCLEIALRAQTKRFLAHPLVVEQLEAIWAGSIVFHATADSLHRASSPNQSLGASQLYSPGPPGDALLRRSVTLYNPGDASLFKLSRLRVPRYRNFLSTCSFAILLGLFLAVLIQRSLEITSLEIVFWFWCGGYILDELVGFSEQGFSLYLASFWNTFDLGILLLLGVHLCLRLYGILMPDLRKHSVANAAYDVLAADAILLFPRLFSILDHYRYFSQLLIAFRMMASDLIAVFVLILISCSGFLAALTLSFGNDELDKPASVAYALFQMLMGFTPAAWERWDSYNALGKTILTLFLFICHFLVVTILITVLTNSFMAIVANANEEHQFVFAVNTISMVKSDSLFSYIPPTNILGWFLAPLRFFIPFPRFVLLNRTLIKLTHFPVLFTIFLYEKSVLRTSIVQEVEKIEPRGRSSAQENENPGIKTLVTPARRRIREPSVATWRKDKALDAVFAHDLRTTSKSQTRLRTSMAVDNWMQNVGTGAMSPPMEPDRSVVDGLESHRSVYRRRHSSRKRREFSSMTRSVASDPEDFGGFTDVLSPPLDPFRVNRDPLSTGPGLDVIQASDVDGDDEGPASDQEELQSMSRRDHSIGGHRHEDRLFPNRLALDEEIAASRRGVKLGSPRSKKPMADPGHSSRKERPRHHLRHVSSATVIYKPVGPVLEEEPSTPGKSTATVKTEKAVEIKPPKLEAPVSAAKSLSNTPGLRTPNKPIPSAKPRPVIPSKTDPTFMSAPNLAGMVRMYRREEPVRTSLAMDLGSDIGDNKAMGGGFVGGIPASFATQMAYATGGLRPQRSSSDENELFGRLVLARMNKLEEGLKEVIYEVRESRLATRQNSPMRSRSRTGRTMRTSAKRSKQAKREKRVYSKGYEEPSVAQSAEGGGSMKEAGIDHHDWEDEELLQQVKSGSV